MLARIITHTHKVYVVLVVYEILHRTPVEIRPTANAALAAQLDILGPADAPDVARDGQRFPDALNTEAGNNTYPLKRISHCTRCTFTC
jgi:hypothetical protein